MDVILLERIEKLGQMGDIVAVKDGYARNFLLPQKKALRATEESKAQFDTQRIQLEAENLKRRGEAGTVAESMSDVSIIMVRQAGDNGQLYGSVTSRDISDGVTADGYTIDRSQIVLNRPIKTLGLHVVDVRLHPEVQITVTVNVARSPEEAKLQARGIDVTAMEDYVEEDAETEAESVFAAPDEETGGDPAALESAEESTDAE